MRSFALLSNEISESDQLDHSDLSLAFQLRLFADVNKSIFESCNALSMVNISEHQTHCFMKFHASIKAESSFFIFDDDTHRAVWQRLGELCLSPNLNFATIYSLECDSSGTGLILQRLQLTYRNKLKETIHELQQPKTDPLVMRQDKDYLESMMIDLFKGKANQSFDEYQRQIAAFCDMEFASLPIPDLPDAVEICQSVLWQFITESPYLPVYAESFNSKLIKCWANRVAEMVVEEDRRQRPLEEVVVMPSAMPVAMEEVPVEFAGEALVAIEDNHVEDKVVSLKSLCLCFLSELNQSAINLKQSSHKKADGVGDMIKYLEAIAASESELVATEADVLGTLQEFISHHQRATSRVAKLFSRNDDAKEAIYARVNGARSLSALVANMQTSRWRANANMFHTVSGYQDLLKSKILPLLSMRDAATFAGTCTEFRSYINLYKDPVWLFNSVKKLSVAQLYRFLKVREPAIREMYQVVMQRKSSDAEIKAVQILKALIMNVARHDEEGISYSMLVDLRNYLVINAASTPSHFIHSISFIIDLLGKLQQNPGLQWDELGGFAPWSYQLYPDNSVFYKNLRGMNLCSTNLEDGNWEYACFDGANLKTAYFGRNKLKSTEFLFDENLYAMLITRKYLGLRLPKVIYFGEDADVALVYNIIALFSNAFSMDLSASLLSATQTICRQFNRDKFITSDLPLEQFRKAHYIEIQYEVLQQVLAVANRFVIKGRIFEALHLLSVVYQSDLCSQKFGTSIHRTLKYGWFGDRVGCHPGSIIEATFKKIVKDNQFAMTPEVEARLNERPKLTIFHDTYYLQMRIENSPYAATLN